MFRARQTIAATAVLIASALAVAPAAGARGHASHPAAHRVAGRGGHACSVRRHGRAVHGRTCAGATHGRSRSHAPAHVAPAAPATPEVPRPAGSATIAQVLATPCQNTEVTPEPGNVALVEAAVLCLINHERASHGEAPLHLNPDLQRAADEHDQELVTADYFAHVSPTGVTPVGRIEATGYVPGPSFGYVIGENLAWGTLSLSTPQAIVSAWIGSPGHLANILESQYTDTGVAVVPSVPPSLSQGEAGATYAQEFGVILG